MKGTSQGAITAAARTLPAFEVPDAHEVRGFSEWKDFVHDTFPWLEHRNHHAGRFEARVSSYRVSSLSFATIRAAGSEVIRTRHLSETADAGFVKVMWQRTGILHIEQDGRQCSLTDGQVAVCDTARPYRVVLSDDASFAVLMLPHEAVGRWNEWAHRVCATRLPGVATSQAALSALMALLVLPKDIVQAEGEPVLKAVRWLLSETLRQAGGRDDDCPPEDMRIMKARRHIMDHIADPGLKADDIASALCMSRRSLYTLFKDYKVTPGRLIHDVRLEQAFQYLEDERHARRKITDIAFDLGYGDYATFSRLFRARFGITPSGHRLRRRRSGASFALV